MRGKDVRLSVLSYARTKEYFHFMPFSCKYEGITIDDSDMLSLFHKNLNEFDLKDDTTDEFKASDAFEVTNLQLGFSHLWKRFEQMKTLKLSVGSTDKSMKSYRKELWFDATSRDAKHVIRFKFEYAEAQNKTIIIDKTPFLVEWLRVSKTDGKKYEPYARMTVMVTESHNEQPASMIPLFLVPTGYGCGRDASHSQATDAGIHLLFPNSDGSVNLEITTTSWLDNSRSDSSVQIVHAFPQTENKKLYNDFEYYSIDSRDLSSGNKKKVVWKIDASQRPFASLPLVYEMTGNCNSFSRTSCSCKSYRATGNEAKPSIELVPLSMSKDGKDSLRISLEDLAHLFMEPSKDGFKFIRNVVLSSKDTIGVYEKRFDSHEFKISGNVWPGVVSVVKTLTFYFVDKDSSGYLVEPGSELELHLFEDVYAATPIFKTKIVLEFKSPVTLLQISDSIDISHCFEQQPLDALVRYELASEEHAVAIAASETKSAASLFLRSLLATSPLHLQSISSSISLVARQSELLIKLSIVDLPLSHTFSASANKALEWTEGAEALIRHTATSADHCARVCRHYSCTCFSLKVRECIVALDSSNYKVIDDRSSVLYVANLESMAASGNTRQPADTKSLVLGDAFAFEASARKLLAYGKPRALVSLLSQYIKHCYSEVSQSDKKCLYEPLKFSFFLDEEIKLIPASVERISATDISSANDDDDDEDLDSRDDADLLDSAPEPQYDLSIKDKKITKNIVAEFSADTYEDCERACADENCRSFSYCELNAIRAKHCSLTSMHLPRDLKLASEEQASCSIYSLDYLSKFEHFSSHKVPKPVKSLKSIVKSNRRDCAGQCIEFVPTNGNTKLCESFVFCGNEERCYLQAYHATTDESENNFVDDKDNNNNNNNSLCDLYSRSYLSDFDEMLATKLVPTTETKQTDSSSTLDLGDDENFGSEQCAKLCIASIEQQQSPQDSSDPRRCHAFSVCQDGTKHICARGLATSSFKLKQENFARNQQCTTFLVSKNSQYYNVLHNVTKQTNDEEKKNDDTDDEHFNRRDIDFSNIEEHARRQEMLNQTVGFWMGSFLFFSGTFIGIAAVIVYRRRVELMTKIQTAYAVVRYKHRY